MMQLSRDYYLKPFIDLLDGGAPPAVCADWLDEAGLCLPDAHVDVCMMYARDRVACEGLYLCEKCKAEGQHLFNAQRECDHCHTEFVCKLPPIIPTDFRQDVFAEWCGRCWGPDVGKRCADPQLIGEAVQTHRGPAIDFSEAVMYGRQEIDLSRSRPPIIRQLKRLTLALVPVTQTVEATLTEAEIKTLGFREGSAVRDAESWLIARGFMPDVGGIQSDDTLGDPLTGQHFTRLYQRIPVAELVPVEMEQGFNNHRYTVEAGAEIHAGQTLTVGNDGRVVPSTSEYQQHIGYARRVYRAGELIRLP